MTHEGWTWRLVVTGQDKIITEKNKSNSLLNPENMKPGGAREGDPKRNVSPVWLWVTPHMNNPGAPLPLWGGCGCITGNGVCLGTVATSSWSHRISHLRFGAPSVLRRNGECQARQSVRSSASTVVDFSRASSPGVSVLKS